MQLGFCGYVSQVLDGRLRLANDVKIEVAESALGPVGLYVAIN